MGKSNYIEKNIDIIRDNIYTEKNIYMILSLTLIIDAITGIFINILEIERSPLGMIYRGLIFIYFLFYWVTDNKKNVRWFIGLCSYFAVNILFSYFMYHNSIKGIFFDVIEAFKLMLMPTIIIGILSLKKRNIMSKKTLENVVFSSVNILLIIYFVGLALGIGKTTYAGAGYKSVFNANNSFNIVVIVLFIFQIEKAFNNNNKLDYLKSILLCGILLILGSKTSLIFVPIYFILKLIIDFKRLNFKEILKPTLITLISIIIVIIIFFNEQLINIINHQIYFIQRESDSLMTYFLSGRDKYLYVAYEQYKTNFILILPILGVGSYFNQMGIATSIGFSTIKNIEMDFFDIFFSNGIIGLILTYGVCIYLFVINFKKIKNNKNTPEAISLIVIILFSILAGHVFPDAMSATFLAIVLGMICI